MPETNQIEDLKRLLVDNLAETRMLKEDIGKIKRFMRTRTIISVIWIIAFVLPTLLALLYVPQLIKMFSGSAGSDNVVKFLQLLQ